tara:strand:- start:739 stop:1047 length:309 start_codon:yes stop_codon:yes gene_type:complete
VKVVVEIEDEKLVQIHALFKRLGFSTRSKLFYALLQGIYEDDDLLMEYLDRYIRKNDLQRKSHQNRLRKMRDKGKQLKDEMLLNDDEIQNIYDIIEKDKPDF